VRQIPFLCLANSSRDGGHCIGGIDLETGTWVRPVGIGRRSAALSDAEVIVQGTGKVLRPFNIALLTVGDDVHEVGQPENAALMEGIPPFQQLPTQMKPRFPVDLGAFLHRGELIFSMKSGRISHSDLVALEPKNSLALLTVEEPECSYRPGKGWRMKIPSGSNNYELPITDPAFPTRESHSGRWVVCVSLGSLHKGFHYALVAMATPMHEIPEGLHFRESLTETTVFKALKEWRRLKMLEAKRPAYTFFSDATLRELALKQPSTEQELFDVFGMGPVRVDRFGKELIEVIFDSRSH